MIAFDHAEDCFDLPTLPKNSLVKLLLHQPAIFAAKRFLARTAVFGRDDALYVVSLTCKSMIGFAVVTGICEQLIDAYFVRRGSEDLAELVDIDPRAPCGNDRQDRVSATVAENCQLRPTPIVRVFAGLKFFAAFSRNEITADVTSLQAGRIHGSQRDVTIGLDCLNGAVQELLGRGETQ